MDYTISSTKYDRNRFDAAGRNVKAEKAYFAGQLGYATFDKTLTIDSLYDGEGRMTKRIEFHTSQQTGAPGLPYIESEKVEYFLNSSVIDQVLSEINEDGSKKITYVFAGSGVLAHIKQNPYWRHQDLITGSFQDIAQNGGKGYGMDPPFSGEIASLGEYVPILDPDDSEEMGGMLAPLTFRYGSEVQDVEICEYDRVPLPCHGWAVTVSTVEYRLQVRYRGDERHGLNSHDIRSIARPFLSTSRVDFRLCDDGNVNCGALERGEETPFIQFFGFFIHSTFIKDDEPIDDEDLDKLRTDLAALEADSYCGMFLRYLRAFIPNPRTRASNPTYKFSGSFVENFDRIRTEGSFQLADIAADGDYLNNRIRLNRARFLQPDEPWAAKALENGSIILVAPHLAESVGAQFMLSRRFFVIGTLVHELTHGSYPPTESDRWAVSHEEMAAAALRALAVMGIDPILKDTSLGSGNATNTFDIAFYQACGHVPVGN